MSEQTINQRLRFLVEKLATSTRAFSEALGESSGNTQNYIGARQIEPKYEYLAKVLKHFSSVNANWLMTGEGEPFLYPLSENTLPTANAKKISRSQIVGTNHGNAYQENNATPAAADVEAIKNKLALAEKEVEHLKAQLAAKDDVIASKDALVALQAETLSLLRGGYTRPN